MVYQLLVGHTWDCYSKGRYRDSESWTLTTEAMTGASGVVDIPY
jgi:hypothetical protein